MIRGLHPMFYSSQADELREFLHDKSGSNGTDVGEGWLIFDAPEADIGVHPTNGNDPASGTADIHFYCDDIKETVPTLRERGVEFTQEVEDHGYVVLFKETGGLVTDDSPGLVLLPWVMEPRRHGVGVDGQP